MKNKKNRFFIIVFVLIVIFLLNILTEIKVPCLFKNITGLYCAGCGVTRMFLALLNLDFYQAFRYNSYVFCILPIIIMYLFFELRNIFLLKSNPLNSKKFNKLWYILLISCILFMIMRNIEYFSYLIPTKI